MSEEMVGLVLDDATEKMAKAVVHARQEFSTIRTGRAAPALVEAFIKQFCPFIRLAPLAKAENPHHGGSVRQGQGEDVAELQPLGRVEDPATVEADMALLDETHRGGARPGEAREPEPFVEPLAVLAHRVSGAARHCVSPCGLPSGP